MGAPRRAHVAALSALAALLLLLLARLPPPRLQPRPAYVSTLALHPESLPAPVSDSPKAPQSIPSSSTPAPNSTSSIRLIDSSSRSSHNSSQTPANQTAADRPDKVAKTEKLKNSGVVLTKDIYVAGHERPHPELCPALGAKIRLLILVSSAPSHSQARDAVRLTWGHYAARNDVAFAFVLGSPPNSLKSAIDAEDTLYGDIIIGRSIDAYSNLTLKTLSMLEWADTYCPRAPRILKTDDDMFINVPRLLQFMETNGRANATKTIWGKVLKKAYPKRAASSKYYLSVAQFPAKVLPQFATGPAYLLTRDAATALLAAAPEEPYLRLEDVFITGVLAGKLGLKRVSSPEFYNKRVALHPCAVQRGIAIHMVRYHEQFDLWRKLLDGKTKCSG